jgi:hypothetical protein
MRAPAGRGVRTPETAFRTRLATATSTRPIHVFPGAGVGSRSVCALGARALPRRAATCSRPAEGRPDTRRTACRTRAATTCRSERKGGPGLLRAPRLLGGARRPSARVGVALVRWKGPSAVTPLASAARNGLRASGRKPGANRRGRVDVRVYRWACDFRACVEGSGNGNVCGGSARTSGAGCTAKRRGLNLIGGNAPRRDVAGYCSKPARGPRLEPGNSLEEAHMGQPERCPPTAGGPKGPRMAPPYRR